MHYKNEVEENLNINLKINYFEEKNTFVEN